MTKTNSAIPIGERIDDRLRSLGKSRAWLAGQTGLERSTISRAITGRRTNPTAETLDHIAGVFEITLAELVKGTTAEGRMANEERLTPKSEHDAVMQQMLNFEAEVIELRAVQRQRDEIARETERALDAARAQYAELHREFLAVERERNEWKLEARRHEGDVGRYREGLMRAVKDVATLRSQLAQSIQLVEDTRLTGRVTAVLAGFAAVVTAASYLSDTKSKPKRTKKTPKEPAT